MSGPEGARPAKRRVLRWLPWLLLVAVAATALALAGGTGSRDRSVESRVEQLSETLRCPTCQGLSVADSPSSTARAIRDDVRRRVEAGESDEEIKQAYVERYGEWILLAPRSDGIAAVVWALPVAALAGTAAGLFLAFRRWRRDPVPRAAEGDRDLVARALEERER